MNDIKFNSQICTTKEQSQRLLDLGLKPETADMHYMAKTHWGDNWFIPTNERWYCLGLGYQDELRHRYNGTVEVIPAWSLHRLLEVICNKECEEHYYFDFSMDYDSMADVYDSIIEVIERHIKDNFINKEYLKQ